MEDYNDGNLPNNGRHGGSRKSLGKTKRLLKGTFKKYIKKVKQVLGKTNKTIKKLPSRVNSMLSRSLRSKKHGRSKN